VKRAAAGIVTAAVALAGLAACGGSGPADAANAYLKAWASGDVAGAASHTDSPDAAGRALTALRRDLRLARVHATLGHVSSSGSAADAEADVDLTVAGAGDWRYLTSLALVHGHSGWLVHWTPKDIHPQYAPGTRLTLQRLLPPRAALLDGNGQPLFTEQPVVDVGIEPQRLGTSKATTLATVARVLHVDAKGLTAAVAAAKPNQFVPVITLRRAAYDTVKARIYALPGTVFRSSTQLLPPKTGFGRALLGGVGQATADVVSSSHGRYAPGDEVGLSGLQLAFQQRLSGTATTSIVVRDPSGVTIATLKTFPGSRGGDVRTTLDVATQEAAEAALAGETKPAALVAVRPSDAAILGVANTPDATSYDRGLSGRYPPGSTFKVVTTYALLAAGVTPSTAIPCPASLTVDGKPFHNFEGETSAGATFADDFARSCNTAFIAASQRLSDQALGKAATALGVGATWHLPLDSFSGSVPAPADAADQAAEAIGQGRVLVSPLAMALMAAAVDTGRPRGPVLVTDPPQPAASSLAALDQARLAQLRSLMRRVVTSGTAAPAHLPTGTFGKTGTAEFGTGNPPQTHAWFIGYRGDLAFAVLVEGGGVGGAVAAPLAARFLARLH
jgi:cell division protein FtsI/penicillin-binding protein 2